MRVYLSLLLSGLTCNWLYAFIYAYNLALQPTVSQKSDRKNYYQSHKQKAQQSETAEQTSRRRHSDKLHKKASRADETPQQTKHRQQMNKTNMSQTRLAKKLKVETVDDAMKNFKAECKKQPVYICTSCHRLL